MQSYFSHSPSSYYGDSLFFLSIGLFKIFDKNVEKIILLDADLKFKHDIRDLYSVFNSFNETNLIGIANDNQPVYSHLFWQYRQENPNTRLFYYYYYYCNLKFYFNLIYICLKN